MPTLSSNLNIETKLEEALVDIFTQLNLHFENGLSLSVPHDLIKSLQTYFVKIDNQILKIEYLNQIQNESIDVCIANLEFLDIRHINIFFKEIVRILKPQGILIFIAKHFSSPEYLTSQIITDQEIAAHLNKTIFHFLDYDYLHTFSFLRRHIATQHLNQFFIDYDLYASCYKNIFKQIQKLLKFDFVEVEKNLEDKVVKNIDAVQDKELTEKENEDNEESEEEAEEENERKTEIEIEQDSKDHEELDKTENEQIEELENENEEPEEFEDESESDEVENNELEEELKENELEKNEIESKENENEEELEVKEDEEKEDEDPEEDEEGEVEDDDNEEKNETHQHENHESKNELEKEKSPREEDSSEKMQHKLKHGEHKSHEVHDEHKAIHSNQFLNSYEKLLEKYLKANKVINQKKATNQQQKNEDEPRLKE